MRAVAVGRGRRLARVVLALALAWGATAVPAALPLMVEGERLPNCLSGRYFPVAEHKTASSQFL